MAGSGSSGSPDAAAPSYAVAPAVFKYSQAHATSGIVNATKSHKNARTLSCSARSDRPSSMPSDANLAGRSQFQKLPSIAVAALALNFLAGVGVLEAPYVVYRAGYVLSTVLFVMVAAICSLTSSYILEASARAFAWREAFDPDLFAVREGGASSYGSCSNSSGSRHVDFESDAPGNTNGDTSARVDGAVQDVRFRNECAALSSPILTNDPAWSPSTVQRQRSLSADYAYTVKTPDRLVLPSSVLGEALRRSAVAEAQPQRLSDDVCLDELSGHSSASDGASESTQLTVKLNTLNSAMRLRTLLGLEKDKVRKYITRRDAVSEDSILLVNDFRSLDADQSELAALRPFSDEAPRLFDTVELFDIFAPSWCSVLFQVSLYALLFVALWTYITLFSNVMTSKLPVFASHGAECVTSDGHSAASAGSGCDWTFRFYIVMFLIFALYFSSLDFFQTPMIRFQELFAGLRIVLCALVAVVAVYARRLHLDRSGNVSKEVAEVPLVDASGSVPAVALSLFVFVLHYSLPELAQAMKRKEYTMYIVAACNCAITCVILLVGVTGARWLGADQSSHGLNVTLSHFGGRWWATTASYFVTLFPAIDALSLYPLCAIVLANSLRALLLRVVPSLRARTSRSLTLATRLVTVLLPAIGPLFVDNLLHIIVLSSFPAMVVAVIAPSLLQFYSIRANKRLGATWRAPFSVPFFSTKEFALFLVGVGSATVGVLAWRLEHHVKH